MQDCWRSQPRKWYENHHQKAARLLRLMVSSSWWSLMFGGDSCWLKGSAVCASEGDTWGHGGHGGHKITPSEWPAIISTLGGRIYSDRRAINLNVTKSKCFSEEAIAIQLGSRKKKYNKSYWETAVYGDFNNFGYQQIIQGKEIDDRELHVEIIKRKVIIPDQWNPIISE